MITQAHICWLAAKGFSSKKILDEYGVVDMYVHAMANKMEDCLSYASHKHTYHADIDKFMRSPDGFGVFGFWAFKDGSKLFASCARGIGETFIQQWTITYKDEDEEGKSFMQDMNAWPTQRVEERV